MEIDCADAHLAVGPDVAPVRFNNVPADGQSQPGAASFPHCEKGIEIF